MEIRCGLSFSLQSWSNWRTLRARSFAVT